jgi:carboxypeptidase C (cathepsin A)
VTGRLTAIRQLPPFANQATILPMPCAKTRSFKVLSVNGLFDLATPFFITEFDLAHMELEPKLRGNIEFAYYPSGHMSYLNVDALKQLKTDLAALYTRATPPAR